MKTIQILVKYIERLCQDNEWHIIISDYYNVLRDYESIRPYLAQNNWHTNPYCMKVKESKHFTRRCVALKNAGRRNIKRRGTAGWNFCYCGVAEYTLPIFSGNIHAFTVSVTGFLAPKSQRILTAIANKTKSSLQEIESIRNENLKKITPVIEQRLECYVAVIGNMLEKILENNPLLTFKKDEASHEQKYVLTAIDYIEKHYAEEITPEDVAEECNISLSHLQHLFIKLTCEGIATTIRRKRIERACELLISTHRSVRDIALSCGFYDTNYFSVVFKRIRGMTPLEFRKRKGQN